MEGEEWIFCKWCKLTYKTSKYLSELQSKTQEGRGLRIGKMDGKSYFKLKERNTYKNAYRTARLVFYQMVSLLGLHTNQRPVEMNSTRKERLTTIFVQTIVTGCWVHFQPFIILEHKRVFRQTRPLLIR